MGKGNRTRKAREYRAVPIAPGSHLGDFGAERAAVDLTFGWFGRTMRVHPDASMLREVELVDEATRYDESDPRNVTVIKDQLRTIVHEDDFDEFWSLALKYRQDQTDLQRLQAAIFTALAGRPTSRPGDSSPGPQTTPQKSGSEPDLVMERYTGRPDLQLAVWRADQAAAEAG